MRARSSSNRPPAQESTGGDWTYASLAGQTSFTRTYRTTALRRLHSMAKDSHRVVEGHALSDNCVRSPYARYRVLRNQRRMRNLAYDGSAESGRDFHMAQKQC